MPKFKKNTGYSPFKMKGSPMYRNFGIGASPVKDTEEPNIYQKKHKPVNVFSPEYKRMTEQQRERKYGKDYKEKDKKYWEGKKDITVENVRESIGKVNKRIQDKAKQVDDFIKGPEGGSHLKVTHEGPGKTTIKRTKGKAPKNTTTTTTTTTPKNTKDTKKTKLPTYEQAWNKMSKEKQARWKGDFSKFKKEAEEWNRKNKKK